MTEPKYAWIEEKKDLWCVVREDKAPTPSGFSRWATVERVDVPCDAGYNAYIVIFYLTTIEKFSIFARTKEAALAQAADNHFWRAFRDSKKCEDRMEFSKNLVGWLGKAETAQETP